MSKFLTLFKVLLNINFGISAWKYRFRKEPQKAVRTMLLLLLALIGIGSIVALYGLLTYGIYAAGAMVGDPDIVLALAFLGLQLFLLFTGVLYVMGVFYQSNDLSALAPLPLKPWHIVGAKFSVVMVYEYLMTLPVLLPPVLIYGLGQHMGIFFWIKGLLLILLSPAIPLLLATLLAMALMRVFNLGRHRDLMAIIGGLVMTVAILAVNIFSQRFASQAQLLTNFLTSHTSLIGTISRSFPPAAWATYALAGQGVASLGWLALYAALSVGMLALLLALANRLYYRTALSGEEAVRRRAVRRADRGQRAARPMVSLLRRELKTLFRTPSFALNCLMGSLLLPLIIPFSLLQGNGSAEILGFIHNPAYTQVVTLAAVAFILLTSAINVTASTAFSREGRAFWFARMIPVKPEVQIGAKLLAALVVAAMSTVESLVVFLLFFHISPAQAAICLVLGALGSLSITTVSLIPDLLRPKLGWTNPHEAVKQNLNVMLAMVIGFALILVEAAVAVALLIIGCPAWAVYAAVALLMTVLAWISWVVLKLFAGQYYKI